MILKTHHKNSRTAFKFILTGIVMFEVWSRSWEAFISLLYQSSQGFKNLCMLGGGMGCLWLAVLLM
jgi:hypothetical protein